MLCARASETIKSEMKIRATRKRNLGPPGASDLLSSLSWPSPHSYRESKNSWQTHCSQQRGSNSGLETGLKATLPCDPSFPQNKLIYAVILGFATLRAFYLPLNLSFWLLKADNFYRVAERHRA